MLRFRGKLCLHYLLFFWMKLNMPIWTAAAFLWFGFSLATLNSKVFSVFLLYFCLFFSHFLIPTVQRVQSTQASWMVVLKLFKEAQNFVLLSKFLFHFRNLGQLLLFIGTRIMFVFWNNKFFQKVSSFGI